MDDLEAKARSLSEPMRAGLVARMWGTFSDAPQWYAGHIVQLCESHERLRLELEAAQRQLAEREQSVIVIEDDGEEEDTELWWPEDFGGEGG